MSGTPNSPWSEAESSATLDQLREDYPGYTDNELYAIWCYENGKVPLDQDSRLDLEQWKIHAAEDGRHVLTGGFRVSRALYGRGMRAQRGVAKPKQGPRQPRSAGSDDGGTPYDDGRLSQKALDLAKGYDKARSVLRQAENKYREALEWMKHLQDVDPLALAFLSKSSPTACLLLRESGLLNGSRDARDASPATKEPAELEEVGAD